MGTRNTSSSLVIEAIPTMQKIQRQKSITGYRVLLEGRPVMFKSSMQKSVALSVCEAEQTAGVLCAQDMLYVWHIL